VDIKIIKRKGDPIITAQDAESNCTLGEIKSDRKRCGGYKYDKNINNNDTQVLDSDRRCEKSE
jgi:hypothetical protein